MGFVSYESMTESHQSRSTLLLCSCRYQATVPVQRCIHPHTYIQGQEEQQHRANDRKKKNERREGDVEMRDTMI